MKLVTFAFNRTIVSVMCFCETQASSVAPRLSSLIKGNLAKCYVLTSNTAHAAQSIQILDNSVAL